MSGNIHFTVTGDAQDFKQTMREVREEILDAQGSVDKIRDRLPKALSSRNFFEVKDAVNEAHEALESLGQAIVDTGDLINQMPDGSEKQDMLKVIELLNEEYAELSHSISHAEKSLAILRTALVRGVATFGLAAAAIAGIVVAIRAVTREARETKRALETGFGAVTGQTAEWLNSFSKAKALWESADGDVTKLNAVLRDHKDLLNESGIAITTINDGNTAFINNSDDMQKAIIKRATALAYERAALVAAEKAAQEYVNAELDIAKREANHEKNPFAGGLLSWVIKSYEGEMPSGFVENVESQRIDKANEKDRARAEERAAIWESIYTNLNEKGVAAMQEAEQALNALGLKTTEQTENEKRYNAELQAAVRRMEQYAAAVENLKRIREKNAQTEERTERDLQRQIAQARIDALEEGAEKERRQRELNERAELQAIYDAKQDYVNAYIDRARAEFEAEEKTKKIKDPNYLTQLFDPSSITVDTSAFDRLIEAVMLKQAQTQKDSYKELLREFETYKQAEERINREYDAKIAKINPEDKENIAQAEKLRKKALQELRAQQLQESEVWKKLMGDLSTTSTDVIEEYIKLAEQSLEASTDLSSEDLKNFLQAILDTRMEIAERNPFEALRSSLERYRNALRNGEDPAVALKEMSIAAAATGDSIRTIGESLGSFASVFGEGGQNFGELISSVTSAISDGAAAFSAFARAEEKGGGKEGLQDTIEGITGVISAVTTLATLGKRISDYMNDEGDRSYIEQRQFLHEYELALARFKAEDYETVFGTKTIEATTEAYRKMNEALALYQQTYAKSGSVYGDWIEYGQMMKTAGSSKFGGDLRDMLVRTYKSWFGRSFDRFTRLSDLAPDLWDANGELNIEAAKTFLEVNTQITDEQRKQIQLLIDQKEAYEEASQYLDDTISGIFGSLGADITDIIWDSVVNGGENAWERFTELGGDAVTKIGKQLLQEMVISEYLEQFRQQMRDAYALGNAADTQASLRSIVGQIFDRMGTMLEAGSAVALEYQNWAQEHGFDLSETTSQGRSAVSKAMTSVSQESWDVVDGKITNMMMRLLDVDDRLAVVQDVQYRMYEQVSVIAGHTARLERMDANMNAMRSDIEDIRTRGIKMQQI